MNYDIRRISDYFREVHSRYFIDTNGVVYTSLGLKTSRIRVDGKCININNFRKQNVDKFNTTTKMLIPIPDTNNRYYLKNDGLVLQRLSTRIDENGCVDVCLIRVFDGTDRGNRYKIHRLLAGCFIGDIENKEVHHKNQNRSDNRLENLEILTFEEHRGIGNYLKNHKLDM